MMLFKLSLKNIKKSIKDYAIYFFTLILGVSIFYVFNSIDSQTAMMNVTSRTGEAIDLMIDLLSGVSVFVSFILGFLIIYASRFLIKRRNKEFGIYLTLGMSKRKISMILFFETLLIGIISLIVGLGLGIVLSGLMSVLVVNMFEADMTKFAFTFSSSACIKTIIYFGIMYLVVIIFNTIIVNKLKLIELLQASKKTETIKNKNPYICIFIFIIASLILGYAYYYVTSDSFLDNLDTNIFRPIILGTVATFLIYWSLSGLLFKIIIGMKKVYYKGLNAFTFRQISSKINTTVFSMSIICLMLFITISVLTTGFSMKDSLNSNVKELTPVDLVISKNNLSSDYLSEDISMDLINYSNLSFNEIFEKENMSLSNIDKKLVVSVYNYSNLTFRSFLGNLYENIKKDYETLEYNNYEKIMSISEYNKVASMYGNETYSLNKNEYMIIANQKKTIKLRNQALENNNNLIINGVSLKPKYYECKDGFLEMEAQKMNDGIIIVPDYLLVHLNKKKDYYIANYKEMTKDEIYNFEEYLRDKLYAGENAMILGMNTKLDINEASVGLGAIVTFIALYLGFIFLISSSAILALKELSESSDNKERFIVLRKLGASDEMLNKALFSQIAIFFIAPLILATIHSIFGYKFISNILGALGCEILASSVVSTFTIFVIIYGVYLLITYICSKNIIREK